MSFSSAPCRLIRKRCATPATWKCSVASAKTNRPDFTANEHTVLDKSKAAQLLKLDGLIGQAANATTGTSESEVNNLEARYLSLVADVRKDGTAIQKKLWKADFDKQQAQAEEKDTAMTKLSRELQAGTEESVGLIEEIKAVTP